MLHTYEECLDTARMLESYQREGRGRYREALDGICQLARPERNAHGEVVGAPQIDRNNISIRTLAEATIRDSHGDLCGVEAVREMEYSTRNRGSRTFMEAGGDAVNTADFSNLLGQITYGEVLEQMESPEFIGGQLMEEKGATTQQQEIIPGVSMIGDKAQAVGENEDYPMVGLSEQWIVAPEKIKYGFMMAITEEMIAENKSELVMDHTTKASEALGINQEKDRLNTALGVDTSFRWKNETAQATYSNSFSGFTLDNLIASNALNDFTDLDVVKNAFNDIIDPYTGEPVMMGKTIQLVVPDGLETTADRILNSLETRYGDTSSASGIQTVTAGTPIGRRRKWDILSSQWVDSVTGSSTTWFAGDFKKAFDDRVIWPMGMFVEDGSSGVQFERDWVTRFKVRRKAAPAVRCPWKVIKCTA